MKPDFFLSDLESFAGAFTIFAQEAYEANIHEKRVLNYINKKILKIISSRDIKEPSQPESDQHIKQFFMQLRTEVDIFCNTNRQERNEDFILRLMRRIYIIEGIFIERIHTVGLCSFFVRPTFREDKSKLINNLEILTRGSRDISDEKQQFKVDLDRVIMIVRAVLYTRAKGFWKGLRAAIGFNSERNKNEQVGDSDYRLDEYLKAVCGIAEVGLMNDNSTHVAYAKRALNGFQTEFETREAGPVKNSYVIYLGFLSFIFGSAMIVLYFISPALFSPDSVLVRFRHFFVLFAGVCLGTWLSFSIRKPSIKFNDLAVLEDDLLNPAMRLLFMIGLTSIVGLLFWTNALSVGIGDFRSDFRQSGTFSFLIGALCGVAERGLSRAVARRADDFASGIAPSGSTPAAGTGTLDK